ncbi:hypothetical protein C0Q70_18898 [Pomacea canaliculata]|uniref:Amino acid permease/ SLC12A domain-containing protein n=1 Tax=Pomacea canaliculata TaxID=400727 RepID=A0A2T7NHT0_POMCA|nr:hypothetical protein C0Q70_18898 [Pomacea canaliculata]
MEEGVRKRCEREESTASPDADSDDPKAKSGVTLSRSLGLISGTSIIVGTIIGSGIFVSPKGVLASTGSVGLSLVVWALAGVIALMGALCYSELGTLMSKSGGEYQYFREAFGNAAAYLYAWTSVAVLRPSSLAVISLTFAEYTNTLFNLCGSPVAPCHPRCPGAGAVHGGQACSALRHHYRGFVKLGQGYTTVLATGFENTIDNPATVSLAFYSALWAYDGWNNLNYVVEELDDPGKNLPRANILASILVTAVYVLTNVSYLTVLSTTELLGLQAVAVTWADRVLAGATIIIPLSVMASTFGAANGTAFSGGRVLFAAARHGNLPEVMSFVHYKRRTPVPSLLFTIFLALLMIIPGDIGSLVDFFSFTAWLFYGLTFTTLIIFRFRTPWRHAHRAYKAPIVIPVIMVLVSVYLIVAPIVDEPRIEFLYAALFVVGGLLFYFPLVYFKLKIKVNDHITVLLQLLMELVPSAE